MTPTVPPVETLSDKVIREVRQRIIAGDLAPDAPFTEGDIAEALGVSKAPVREALALLRRLGWVTSQPRSGYRVVALSLHDAHNLSTVRLALAPEAAALAAQRAGHFPSEVRALLSFARRKRAEPAEDLRFHRRIALLSGNAELERVLSEVLFKLARYERFAGLSGGLSEAARDHLPMARAIADRDPDKARAATTTHVTTCRDSLIGALLSSDQLSWPQLTAPPELATSLVS